MKVKSKTKQDLLMEVKELRRRLEEAEGTLRAIRSGAVDDLLLQAVATDLTEQKRHEGTLKEAELTGLASFPRLNPNPVVEVDLAGRVHYSNPAAERLFPDLKKLGLNHPWLFDLDKVSERIEVNAIKAYVRELRVEDCWHQQSIHSVLEGTRLRIYGFDITERKRAEEALYQERDRLAALVRSIPDEVWFADALGQFTLLNPPAGREFRVKEGAPLDVRQLAASLEVLRPDGTARPIEEAPPLRALSGETVINQEEWVRTPATNELRYRQVSAAPVRDGSSNIVGSVCIVRDVTELKQVEQDRERLRIEAENEKNRLEAVMEALPVGLVIIDSQGGVSRANKAFEQVWGSPRPTTVSVGDYAAYKAWWADTGQPVAPEDWASAQAVQKGRAVIGQWLEIQRFDGSRASVINSGAPVFDADGKITGCAVAIQDISDLRRIEKALRESDARTATILKSISDGFMTLDNDLVVTYFNRAAEHLLGSKKEDVLGRNLFNAFPEARGSIFEEKYSWAVKEKKATAFETYFGVEPYADWYDVRVYPHEYGISVYFRVTTEEKKATEAIRRSKERFELLAETASKLLASQQPQEIISELCQAVMIHLDCHAFFNYLADENTQRLHLNTYAGIPEQTAKAIEWLDYGVAVCGCAARDAARIVCENIPVTPDPRTELVKSFGIKAYAAHPLISAGRVIGTLSFGTRSRTAFTEEDLSMMKTVADQVATAMERIRLIREIEKSRDELEARVLERTEQLNKANVSLKAERQLFYDVLETIPAYVVLLTPDYHATFANRTFLERFGESHGRRCFEFLFERSEPCEICETYTVLKTMGPHEWEWTGPDGRIYFVHDFPFTDVDGSTLILEMGIDVTERKRAWDALRDAALYARNLIEASLDPLVTISADGKILDVNCATELATGVPRDELIGNDFSDYFTEPDKAREGYQRVFREGFVRDYPLAVLHRSGTVTDVLYNAAVYRNEAGAVQGVFAAARDITDRKRAEEELKEKEKQIRFFASQCLTAQETERRRIAAELHDDIASSLAGIKFRIEKTAEDMKRGLGSPESMKDISSYLTQTLGEVRRIMADLRPSILDDLGIMPALNWFCREYEKTYSHISVDKEVRISEDEVPDPLKIVIFRISQEAMNNTAKHSNASLINFSLQKVDDRVELTIRDNGHGFQLDETAKGYGLSTMRERTEFSGGTFAIQSIEGKGTIVSASWPLAR
jgi:PAS domain S-box-containing protein